MASRIRILGIIIAVVGVLFVAAGAFAYIKAQEGVASLQAYSAEQNVMLSYNDEGILVDGGETAEAEAIMSLLVNDWKYPVNQADLDPNDPLVNTASEYMYQMATINYHILSGTQTVILTEDKEFNGEVIPAGTYEFLVDGRYYADFNRANPIEGAARGQAWSATALGLIANLGIGTTTASALQLALAVAGLFAAIGALVFFTGIGLVWASRAPVRVPAESLRTTIATPGVAPAPVASR
ncbi:MAG TPA: hypothetical protein VI733_04465 [Candidatus Limnocylindria bacterium]|nr:hypothetical protein [Candidatus Limnocylindria bacterium]